MEMLQELEMMIQDYSGLEEDFLIREFLEELKEIKESVFLTSKSL